MSSVHDAPHPRSRSCSGLVMVEPSIKLLYDEVIEGPLRDQFRIWGTFVELSKMVCFPYTTISNRRISSYSMLGKPAIKRPLCFRKTLQRQSHVDGTGTVRGQVWGLHRPSTTIRFEYCWQHASCYHHTISFCWRSFELPSSYYCCAP